METDMDRQDLGKAPKVIRISKRYRNANLSLLVREFQSAILYLFETRWTLPNLRLSKLKFSATYPDAWIHPSFWLDDNWSIFTRLWNFNESYRRKTWKIFQSICENERWTSFKLFIRFIFINHVPIWNFHWSKNFRNLSLLFGIYFGHSCADHFPRWNFRYGLPILNRCPWLPNPILDGCPWIPNPIFNFRKSETARGRSIDCD